MVPTLKIPKKELLNNGFLNGYINDKNHENIYDNAVYVLFKPSNLDEFKSFLEDEYERTKDIIEDYDYNEGFVVVVYKLDPVFKKDFDIIKTGKYSQTSEKFQKLFPKTIEIVAKGVPSKEYSLQYRIFNKTADLFNFWEEKLGVNFDEKFEVWEGFDLNRETLDINKNNK